MKEKKVIPMRIRFANPMLFPLKTEKKYVEIIDNISDTIKTRNYIINKYIKDGLKRDGLLTPSVEKEIEREINKL